MRNHGRSGEIMALVLPETPNLAWDLAWKCLRMSENLEVSVSV